MAEKMTVLEQVSLLLDVEMALEDLRGASPEDLRLFRNLCYNWEQLAQVVERERRADHG